MEKVCIVCPRSCMLKATYDKQQLIITGNNCKRGPEYLRQELKQPKRMLTTTVKVVGGERACVAVYAREYVNKEDVIDFIKYLKTLEIKAPITNGQVLVDKINDKEVIVCASEQVAAI